MQNGSIHPQRRFEAGPIFLQLLQAEHAEMMLAYRQRNRSFLEPFQPKQTDADYTLERQQAALARGVEEAEAGTAYPFGIFLQENGELIGQLRLSSITRGVFQNAYLGYSMDERHNGRGFMTLAVRAGADIAFCGLGLHRIQAGVMPRNARSIRVLEKNGFVREGYARRYLKINGQWEDHVIYALLAEDVECGEGQG